MHIEYPYFCHQCHAELVVNSQQVVTVLGLDKVILARLCNDKCHHEWVYDRQWSAYVNHWLYHSTRLRRLYDSIADLPLLP